MSTKSIIELVNFTISGRLDSIEEPPCDVYVFHNKIFVETELPGLDKDSLSIKTLGDILVISGIKRRSNVKHARYLRAERFFGAFKKTIKLPFYINDILKVHYDRGIVNVVCSINEKEVY